MLEEMHDENCDAQAQTISHKSSIEVDFASPLQAVQHNS